VDGDEGGGGGSTAAISSNTSVASSRGRARPPASRAHTGRRSPARPPWQWPRAGRWLRGPTRPHGGQFGLGKGTGGIGKGALVFGEFKVHGGCLRFVVVLGRGQRIKVRGPSVALPGAAHCGGLSPWCSQCSSGMACFGGRRQAAVVARGQSARSSSAAWRALQSRVRCRLQAVWSWRRAGRSWAEGAHHVGVKDVLGRVHFLKVLDGAGVQAGNGGGLRVAGRTGLARAVPGTAQKRSAGWRHTGWRRTAAAGRAGKCRQRHVCIIPDSRPAGLACPAHGLQLLSFLLLPAYFRLMVVFTPWLVVLSSNQRAVTVLVWV
jgi:hypothetical protein